jgi:hypothetical protein
VPVEPSDLVQLPLRQPWYATYLQYPTNRYSTDMRGTIVAYYPGVNKIWDVTVDV